MAAETGQAYILDNDGTTVYEVSVTNGGYQSTVALNGNIVTIDCEFAPIEPQGSPTVDTAGITMVCNPGETVTTITLPFAPTKIRFNSGTYDQNFENTTNYIDVEQGQSVTTQYQSGYDSGAGMLLQYFGQGGGSISETWVLNATLTTTVVSFENNPFTSNNESFIGIRGTSKGLNYILPNDQSSLVYMGGWLGEEYRTITFETAPSGDLLAWLQANGTKQAASTKKSVDLTTLSGWANLSDGEHTITIKAKADGYRDSQASEGVSVTKGSTGETWVLNESIDPTTDGSTPTHNVAFVSNDTNFTSITIGKKECLTYDSTIAYDWNELSWASQAYRTITFETAPTGDLLTWLQANGTKQGGVTTHKITFPTDMRVEVNDVGVTSPHELDVDGTIVVTLMAKGLSFYVNGNQVQSGEVLTITNEDIILTAPLGNDTAGDYITIKYKKT